MVGQHAQGSVRRGSMGKAAWGAVHGGAVQHGVGGGGRGVNSLAEIDVRGQWGQTNRGSNELSVVCCHPVWQVWPKPSKRG
jgi:hypothetical protein